MLAQAQTYLNSAGWVADATYGVILRDGNQDLLVNVPEPGTVALFVVALGGLAAGLGRRRGLAQQA